MENRLTPRQWALKRWLEANFKPGYFFSIEEVVNGVDLPSGEKAYKLNKNPYSHDKCINLSSDVKAINWNICEGYKIIVKDTKGGIKLCESADEFNAWKDKQMEKVTRTYQYLNNLQWKTERDGTIPIVNLAGNPVDEPAPVDVYGK